jgi:hypothetical protein
MRVRLLIWLHLASALLFVAPLTIVYAQQAAPANPATWRFAVSGDSRNCGDIVMPAIAAGVKRDNAEFYWHLGDYRLIRAVDEDYEKTHPGTSLIDYENNAWPDFLQHQIVPFGNLPVFLATGNHEFADPGHGILPKNRGEYVAQFADWLNQPAVQKQRLADDPKDHLVKTYYHWVDRAVDFITLDNASTDEFTDEQLKWFKAVLQRDQGNDAIRTLVVGMHASLPDSLSAGHSMNESGQETTSGRQAYAALLDFRNRTHKNVYVLSSHSHFVMDNIYADACHPGENALPGWIVGTAGAVRYRLPADQGKSTIHRTDVYGYLLATVAEDSRIQFEFRPLNQSDVPQDTVNEFGKDQVTSCFDKNQNMSPIGGPTCPVPAQ